MLTIAHPLTPHPLNLAFVAAQITASANAPTIARLPCSSSAAPIADGVIPRQSPAPHARLPGDRFEPPAHSPATAPSGPECAYPPASAEVCFQMPGTVLRARAFRAISESVLRQFRRWLQPPLP